jgi:hypothetical protein
MLLLTSVVSLGPITSMIAAPTKECSCLAAWVRGLGVPALFFVLYTLLPGWITESKDIF